jgi:hypothetical protein
MRHHLLTLLMLTSAPLICGGESATAGDLRGRVAGATVASPAVVWVEGLPAASPVHRDTVITHRDGTLEPLVSIGFVGNSFVLRNDDDRLHTTHLSLRLAYQKAVSQRPLQSGATLFNVALPKAGQEVRKPIEPFYRYRADTGFIEARCNPHPDERAYVLVFDHPHAVLTGADGSFSIPNLPAGTHEAYVWHAGIVTTGHDFTMADEGTAELEIAVD